MGKFDHAAEEIKAAASISLGCVTVGNLAKVPPCVNMGTDIRSKGTDHRRTGTDIRSTGTDHRSTGTDDVALRVLIIALRVLMTSH